MPQSQPIIVWFRQDLRLSDHAALWHACQMGRPIIPLYILDDVNPGQWKMGGASRWWLHHSLAALDQSLQKVGSQLFILQGDSLTLFPQLIKKYGVHAIYWNRCYEPFFLKLDQQLTELLPSCQSFNCSLLFEPDEVLNQQHQFFKVFGAFWKKCLKISATIPQPLAPPKKFTTAKIAAETLSSLHLLPTHPNWAQGWDKIWHVGEQAAQQKLKSFVEGNLNQYEKVRNFPAHLSSSSLSAALHFGEISPRQIFHAVQGHPNEAKFLSELAWRDFTHYQLYHYPVLDSQPWNQKFANFPWRKDSVALKKWQQGQTGFPIVDAGMRQLWQTGFMHNRVRMITSSFLVKHLLISWKEGQEWFWDTLIDADLANNAANWQWIAGCGFNPSPFFRIFNPLIQAKKFDPEGIYIKRWVPELAHLPKSQIHNPHAFKLTNLDYPAPIIEAEEGRERALTTSRKFRRGELEEEPVEKEEETVD